MTRYSVLDACCGSRMFWYDRQDSRAVFVDLRVESKTLPDSSYKNGLLKIEVEPDVQADFRNLPFKSGVFSTVIYDPPHLSRNGKRSRYRYKYGVLPKNRQAALALLRAGFKECERVLQPGGTLIFKWHEDEIPIKFVLRLATIKPLIGTRHGKGLKTRFVVFVKPAD